MTDPATFWRERGILKFYREDQPYRQWMAEKVLAENPKTVLEFGCNVGTTLYDITQKDSSVKVVGVDINPKAIAFGKNRTSKLDLRVGDETWLADQPDDAFDVAFTVSVLDHIPDITYTLEQLTRIAPTLLLLEPWTGHEGDVAEDGITANSQTWSWDLSARLKELGWRVTARKHPLQEGEGLHSLYRLYTARREAAEAESLDGTSAAHS